MTAELWDAIQVMQRDARIDTIVDLANLRTSRDESGMFQFEANLCGKKVMAPFADNLQHATEALGAVKRWIKRTWDEHNRESEACG